ncbi:MAG: hypothetical protein IPK62_15570 [Bacteroidetes bacterium]|nr:hypothetical protein [Bacteroidota bacterium]
MTEITLYKNKAAVDTVQFPTDWSELSAKELSFIAEAIYAGKLKEADLFLCIIMNRSRKKNLIPLLDLEQCAIDGIPLVKFITEEIMLTKNPMPEVKDYFGPADNFEDLTCGEFEDAEACFFSLKEMKEEKYLNSLMATLWRKKVNGKRIPYIDYDVKPHMSVFEKINFKNKIIVFLWYIGCRENIAKLFPLIFSGEGPESDTPPALAFTNCIHMGAGVKNGTRDNIRKMLLKEFLYDIQLQLIADQNNANQPEK